MNNFDDLLSDAQLEQMVSNEDPTVSIQIPLRQTQSIGQPTAEVKKKAILGKLKAKSTKQLSALPKSDSPTAPIIRTDRVLPSGLTIHQIYKNAGLGSGSEDRGFNVFRVESMLDDTSIIELDDRAKEAAVIMALKTHNVELSSVIDDGRDHQLALEEHDLHFQDEIKTMNLQLETENTRLHAEIERYANPRLERMEANQKRLDELESTYEKWRERKSIETQRLDKMLNRWTGGTPNVTAPMIAHQKTKRETEPLPTAPPLFETYEEESSFLEPVVLKSSELDSDVTQLANSFPIETYPQPVIPDLDTANNAFRSSSDFDESDDDYDADLTFQSSMKSKTFGNLTYYSWVLLSVVLWIFGALTLATVITSMKAVAALGLTFGIPLGLALIMAMVSKGHGRWFGYMAFLGYWSLGLIVLAHLDIDNLAKLLSTDPVWLTEVSNLDGTMIVLPDFLASPLTKVSNLYGEFLYSSGLATQP